MAGCQKGRPEVLGGSWRGQAAAPRPGANMVLGGTLGLVFLPSEAEACISRDPMTPHVHSLCVCVCKHA